MPNANAPHAKAGFKAVQLADPTAPSAKSAPSGTLLSQTVLANRAPITTVDVIDAAPLAALTAHRAGLSFKTGKHAGSIRSADIHTLYHY